jgi:uncharacterized protein (UPF0335 family)
VEDVTFTVDSRHANVAREAAKKLRAGVPPETLEAIHDTIHNHKRAPSADGIAADRLRSIIERVERLEEERKVLGSDIKDIFAEAKSAGFDVKVLRQLISIRKKEPAEVEEQESLLDVYRRALGM